MTNQSKERLSALEVDLIEEGDSFSVEEMERAVKAAGFEFRRASTGEAFIANTGEQQ